MTRIVVFSDTHRDIRGCIKVLDNLIGVNAVIHLGDCVADAVELKKIYKDIPFYFVSGNNDIFSYYDAESVVSFENYNIFCTHGHTYSEEKLVSKAKSLNCKIALFGHTHKSIIKTLDGITLLNPGSISRPRDDGPGYGIIEIENSKISCCIIKTENRF